jgi:hypothetical protein
MWTGDEAMPITRFIQGAAFDPEQVESLSAAFTKACHELGLVDRTDPLVEIVATKIISIAKNGERDPDRLCRQAIAALNLPSAG